MIMKKNKIKHFTFCIYIFCFIFAPPLVPQINFIFIVFLFSLFNVVTKYKREVKEIYKKSKMKLFIQLMLISYIYILLIMVIGTLFDTVNFSNYITVLYRFFLITPVIITCILYIILRCKELNYDLTDLLRALIIAGLLQALISISMALIPSVKQFFVTVMYFNTGDTLSQNIWHFQRRYFAFSQNVLDTFGYGTGIISVLPVFFAIYRKNLMYILFTPILLIVPLLNSRTGLVIAFIGVVFVLPYLLFRSRIKDLLSIFIILSILLFTSSMVLNYLTESLPTTMSWVTSGINDTLGFFKGEVSNDSVSIVTSEVMWFFPESIYILIGTGHSVYGASGYPHSDIGYVNDIWIGGLIGLLLLYFPFINVFYKAFKSKNQIDKILITFLCVSFFVANIKTIIVSYNVGTSIILLLTFFVIYNNQNDELVKDSNHMRPRNNLKVQ